MQRIIDATAAAAQPAVPTLSGTTGFFTEGVPGTVAATRARGWWLNMVQEELMTLLTAAGITPDTTATEFTGVLRAIRSLGRIKLTANTTLNVTSGGDDTTGSLTLPFASPQGAWNYAQARLDLAGFGLTISIGAGTFSGPGGAGFGGIGQLLGQAGAVAFIGAGSATILTASTNTTFYALYGANISVSYLTLTNACPTAAGTLTAVGSSMITIGAGVVFGLCSGATASQIAASVSAVVYITANYTISGGCPGSHIVSQYNSMVYCSPGDAITITLTGTPAFAYFAYAYDAGSVVFRNTTFTGGATGSRYSLGINAIIDTALSSPTTYLPGSTAGVTSNAGGVYF